MHKRSALAVSAVAALVAAAVVYFRTDRTPLHYTGFVEGEERVIRSEVTGRVLEVRYAEGAAVPPNSVIAVFDDREIQSRIKSKQEELALVDAELQTQEERIRLVESTWKRDVAASAAAVEEAQAAARLAEQTLQREEELVKRGASTPQLLDDRRAARDQTRGGLGRAREMLARAEAEERTILVSQRELVTLRAKRELTQAQLEELRVTQSKFAVRSPDVPTVVQTQFIWPGELAQLGSAILSVLDPMDKYVQIYVPVADVGRLRLGQRVEIELDSRPAERLPGEISFIADTANFTPEKIETRSDRMGQVYRAKVRILEGVERFQPGTEGNVYLAEQGTE